MTLTLTLLHDDGDDDDDDDDGGDDDDNDDDDDDEWCIHCVYPLRCNRDHKDLNLNLHFPMASYDMSQMCFFDVNMNDYL